MKKHVFTAGPSVLPQEVLIKASAAVNDLDSKGYSILEISHRSSEFGEIIEKAKNLIKELYQLEDQFEVLFLHGGASTQFAMVPFNFLKENETAAYIDTGTWSSKAISEAKYFGGVSVCASSEDKQYSYIPTDYEIPSSAKYLHITSNNTIYGTQYHQYPTVDVPMVIDMCSDILSCPVDFSKVDLAYASAQKNLGPAGTSVVLIKKSMMERIDKRIPAIFDYRVHVAKDSLLNTPSVFSIYTSMLTLEWLKEQGGLSAIEERNKQKATMVYEMIDAYSVFKGHAKVSDRSIMNACFTLSDDSLNEAFLNLTKEAGIIGIKGHRSVGGFRASLYNALEMESVKVLVDIMKNFGEKYS